ncbi:MAG: hypothetical protein U5J62_00200 [Desulfurivibrio sp.]|nr:hypothetical protein [Desulfurivibrio sp.]
MVLSNVDQRRLAIHDTDFGIGKDVGLPCSDSIASSNRVNGLGPTVISLVTPPPLAAIRMVNDAIGAKKLKIKLLAA